MQAQFLARMLLAGAIDLRELGPGLRAHPAEADLDDVIQA